MTSSENPQSSENLRVKTAATHGNDYALASINMYMNAAWARGDIRTKRPSRAEDVARKLAEEEALKNHIGAEIFSPGAGVGLDIGSGSRPSWRDPQPVSLLVERFVKDKGWGERVEVASLSARWEEIAGPTLSQHAKIEDFSDDGTLTIRTSSTSWATQLRVLQSTLHKNIDQLVGAGVVKDIIIKGPTQRSWKHGKYSVPGRGPRDTYG